MFIKLTYLLIMLSLALAEDELVRDLSGEHNGNRVTVCIGNGTACEGALWDTQWVIVRASCIADKPMYQMTVIRTTHREHCTEYVKELTEKNESVHRIELVLKHPAYAYSPRAEYDLALLRLQYPYPTVERVADPAVANTLLQKFEPWLENTIRSNRIHKPYIHPYARRFGVNIFESPVKMFISLVVIPSTLFVVFFLFITCYTNPKGRVPIRQYDII